MARLVAAATLALAAFAVTTAPALAASPPYPGGSVGYDSSVYQCGAPAREPSGSWP